MSWSFHVAYSPASASATAAQRVCTLRFVSSCQGWHTSSCATACCSFPQAALNALILQALQSEMLPIVRAPNCHSSKSFCSLTALLPRKARLQVLPLQLFFLPDQQLKSGEKFIDKIPASSERLLVEAVLSHHHSSTHMQVAGRSSGRKHCMALTRYRGI